MKQVTVLELPFGASRRFIRAGSYLNYPGGMYGVKLAPEIEKAANMVVPIVDFGLPAKSDTYPALRTILYQVALGRPVYLGCYGGLGRTGTFLALLYKALGIKEPIAYVRHIYDRRAVETRDQERFVKNFFMVPLRLDVWRARATAFMIDTHLAALRASIDTHLAALHASPTMVKYKGSRKPAKECE